MPLNTWLLRHHLKSCCLIHSWLFPSPFLLLPLFLHPLIIWSLQFFDEWVFQFRPNLIMFFYKTDLSGPNLFKTFSSLIQGQILVLPVLNWIPDIRSSHVLSLKVILHISEVNCTDLFVVDTIHSSLPWGLDILTENQGETIRGIFILQQEHLLHHS